MPRPLKDADAAYAELVKILGVAADPALMAAYRKAVARYGQTPKFGAFFQLIHDLRAIFEGLSGDRAGPPLDRANDPFVFFVRGVLKLVDPHAVVLLDLEAVVAAVLAERGPGARGDAP